MLNFRKRTAFLSTAAAISVFAAGAAGAQGLRDGIGPAEFPPASFTANQYVDSNGCVFVRAGISGVTEWVPRVNREREMMCGFEPSQTVAATGIATPVDVPNPLDTQVAGLPTRDAQVEPAAEVATPVTAAAASSAPATVPVPVEDVTPASAATTAPLTATAPLSRPEIVPVQTVATAPITSGPAATTSQEQTSAVASEATVPAATLASIEPTASPSPQIITVPASEPAQLIMSKSQACEGLTGLQPHITSQRTGAPVDCGRAPAIAVVAPAVAEAPVETQPTEAARADTTPAVEPERLSRAQACADMQATGRQYMSTTTGLPLACGAQNQPAAAPTLFAGVREGLTSPQLTYSNPLDAPAGAIADHSVRPQTASASPQHYTNPLDSPPGSLAFSTAVTTPEAQTVQRARTASSSQGLLTALVGRPNPYWNVGRAAEVASVTVPDGYDRVWGDGRLNTQRGNGATPRAPATVRFAATPIAPQAQGVTRAAPQAAEPQAVVAPRAQVSGHTYIQVGTYATRDQAQSVAHGLRAQGLPMRVGVFNQNGEEMRVVIAGPFRNDRQLQNALGAAQGAGYAGAFTRN